MLSARHRPVVVVAGRAPCRRARACGLRVVAMAVKVSTGKQVCCSKTLTAKKERKEDVAVMVKNVAAFADGHFGDKASGLLEFIAVRDGWEDHVFHIWERYDGNAAMGRLNTAPEFVDFMQRVQPLLEGPVGMALYEWRDGNIGAVCVQGGPKGEGGLDDATGASGAAGGASMKQTSNTVDLTQVNEHEDEEDLQKAFAKTMTKQVDTFKSMFTNILGGLGKKQ